MIWVARTTRSRVSVCRRHKRLVVNYDVSNTSCRCATRTGVRPAGTRRTSSWSVPPLDHAKGSTMDTRRFWPFPVPSAGEKAEPIARGVTFLEKLAHDGYQSYADEGGVLGAAATNGREGEMIPRGGIDRDLRQYWEVILSKASHKRDSFYVDGFENAAEAILRWLQGEQGPQIRSCIGDSVVQRPGERGWQRDH